MQRNNGRRGREMRPETIDDNGQGFLASFRIDTPRNLAIYQNEQVLCSVLYPYSTLCSHPNHKIRLLMCVHQNFIIPKYFVMACEIFSHVHLRTCFVENKQMKNWNFAFLPTLINIYRVECQTTSNSATMAARTFEWMAHEMPMCNVSEYARILHISAKSHMLE